MRQRDKQFPHVSSNVSLSEVGKVFDKVPTLHKLEDERGTVVPAHTVQQSHHVVPRIRACITQSRAARTEVVAEKEGAESGRTLMNFFQHRELSFDCFDT